MINLLAVSVSKLFEVYGELEIIRSALYAQSERITSVSSALLYLSGMETAAVQLRQALAKVDDELRKLELIMQALDTSCRYFKVCESRVMDELEGAALSQRFYQSGFVELDELVQSLANVI